MTLQEKQDQLKGFIKENSSKSSWFLLVAILAIILLAGAVTIVASHCRHCGPPPPTPCVSYAGCSGMPCCNMSCCNMPC